MTVLAKVALLAAVASAATPKSQYIPIPCMANFKVNDWGKCMLKGERFHCPAADVEFTVGCTSAKPEAGTGSLKIERPTAAIVEKSE